ncbi:hypothetical protein [Microcoleus sp.]|uniref:hypothetical protein n=1 Tax=Microcoleus sp. TaxID=44472 RepID=UPI003523B344
MQNRDASEAEPLELHSQAEPGNEVKRGKSGCFRGGASGTAFPGRAWERGIAP